MTERHVLVNTISTLPVEIPGVKDPKQIPDAEIRPLAENIWEQKGRPKQTKEAQDADWYHALAYLTFFRRS